VDAIDARALPVRIVQHINIYVCDKIMIFATDEGHGTKVIATMRWRAVARDRPPEFRDIS